MRDWSIKIFRGGRDQIGSRNKRGRGARPRGCPTGLGGLHLGSHPSSPLRVERGGGREGWGEVRGGEGRPRGGGDGGQWWSGGSQPRVSPILMLLLGGKARERNYEFFIEISAQSSLNTLSSWGNVQLPSYPFIQWSRSNLEWMG